MVAFLLASLATWRVTHLLACEDGPADICVRLRIRLGSGFLGKLMDCFQCLSIWVAMPLALFVSDTFIEWLVAWLAVSGAACLLERLAPDPLVLEPVAEGVQTDGMLRTETGDAAPGSGADAGSASSSDSGDGAAPVER